MILTYKDIVLKLCSKHQIDVEFTTEGPSGFASIDERKIRVPKDMSHVIPFMVALHEIGHIVNGHIKLRFYEEYLAEKYAFEKAEEYGIDAELYLPGAKKYVTHQVAKAWNRGLKFKNIPKEVLDFIDKDIRSSLGLKRRYKFEWEDKCKIT